MKKGDLALFYHSGAEKQIVGTMVVSSHIQTQRKKIRDPQMSNSKAGWTDQSQTRSNKTSEGLDLVRISRLSVMPVSQIWGEILKISQK